MLKTWGGDPMKVETNDLNQPIGEYAKKLESQMGRTTKLGNLFPLTTSYWRFINKHIKDKTWTEYIQGNKLSMLSYRDK